MIGVIEGFTIIAIIIGTGYLFRKSKVVDDGANIVLNKFSFFIGYPCLMFTLLQQRDIHAVFGVSIVVAIISASVIVSIFLLINHYFLHLKASEKIITLMSSAYLNSNNIGLAVATYVLKDPLIVGPFLVFQVALFSPILLVLLDKQKCKENNVNLNIKNIILTPVRNPIIIGVVVGLLFSWTKWKLPAFLEQPFDMFSNCAVPCVLVAYGMSLHGMQLFTKKLSKLELNSLIITFLLKMVIMPISTYLIAHFLFHIEGSLLNSLVVLSALPSAQNVNNYAVVYNKGVTFARDIVFLTTIAAPFITALIVFLIH